MRLHVGLLGAVGRCTHVSCVLFFLLHPQAFGMFMQCTAAAFPTSMAGKDLRFSFAREVEVSNPCQLARAATTCRYAPSPAPAAVYPGLPTANQPALAAATLSACSKGRHPPTHCPTAHSPPPFHPPSRPQSLPNGVKVGVASSINYRRMVASDNK